MLLNVVLSLPKSKLWHWIFLRVVFWLFSFTLEQQSNQITDYFELRLRGYFLMTYIGTE